MSATKEAIAITSTPANFVDIKTVPVEQDQPCRGATMLEFVGPQKSVFSQVAKSTITATVFGMRVQVVLFSFTVSPANRLDPDKKPVGRNKDAIQYLPANSVNVFAVADPIYIRNAAGRVTNVNVFFTRTDISKPAVLGLRAKFEENVANNTDFNPKRKSGTVSFP